MKQSILILTQYFPPETGAPQNRLSDLAQRLQEKGMQVTVLTAMPNYPSMVIDERYRGKVFCKEERQGIRVHRAWIYASTSRSLVSRLLNYFSFVFTSFFAGLFIGRHRWIFCESPPLFLGITARLLCLFKRSHLVFNVSDLWPESAEKLGLVRNRLLLRISTALEESLYRSAWLVTGQTQGIVKSIADRTPGKRVHWLPNGVNLSAFPVGRGERNWRAKQGYLDGDFICLYAGIIGYAQGLDVILQAADELRADRGIRFVMLGSGPEKLRLQQLAGDMKLERVHFVDVVSREEMPRILQSIDAAVVPLRKLELFKGAIPSKIFESLAMEKPVILGVDGEARQLFVDQGNCAKYYEPENAKALAAVVQSLKDHPEECKQLGMNGRRFVQEKFDRAVIADAFYRLLTE